MLTYKEAQQLITQQAHSFGKEKISLEQCTGRVLAETISADRDYPPFNRATMDGYAIKHADFAKGIRTYSILETIFAGQSSTQKNTGGSCYKIMTGAPVPADVDVVIRREDTREENGKVELLIDGCQPFQNISRQGEDFTKGSPVIDRPVICNAAVISLLAAVGKDAVTVERLPKVAILTTGNEIVPVNSAVEPVQIRNSNAWLLKSLLAKQLITPIAVEHIADDKELLRAAFKKVLDADIIITCGGVSAGDADYIPLIAEELGIKILFHKLSIKPGKPVLCGVTPPGGMLFGLPGNPFSSLVTFTLFIQHYLDACNQLTNTGPVQTQLHGVRTKKGTLDEFFPVKLIKSVNAIEPVTFNGSGDIQAALYADGIGFHPAEKDKIETGDSIQWLQL